GRPGVDERRKPGGEVLDDPTCGPPCDGAGGFPVGDAVDQRGELRGVRPMALGGVGRGHRTPSASIRSSLEYPSLTPVSIPEESIASRPSNEPHSEKACSRVRPLPRSVNVM